MRFDAHLGRHWHGGGTTDRQRDDQVVRRLGRLIGRQDDAQRAAIAEEGDHVCVRGSGRGRDDRDERRHTREHGGRCGGGDRRGNQQEQRVAWLGRGGGGIAVIEGRGTRRVR